MHSLETLEYQKLLALVARHAQTPMGREKFMALEPHTSRPPLERDLQLISETITLNEEKQVSWSFSELQEPDDAIAILKIKNAVLEPGRMLELTRLCNQALFARSQIAPEKEFAPGLWQIVDHLPRTLFEAIEKVNRKLLPSGEIDDSASPELIQIRRELNAQRARLTKSLEGLMRRSGEAIQDEIVTLRNDRYVVPVKADFKTKVSGVAHGFSSSGATVFIEPLEAIDANNELAALKAKEENEVARILFSLTEELRNELPSIELAVKIVTELDFIKAKTEFAARFLCVVPEISDNNTLNLKNSRHPLLEENLSKAGVEIVPVSFELSKQKAVMIISGANAGGKTVVLKTAGLLSLMAISGLPVPAESATVPFYSAVLADIGDHQSLSANLSTFSSHISNIAGMMSDLRTPALVLLDEVGTGTDPDEGSALGVTIVDHFRREGAQVMASTHYRGLKIYATNDESVINASVEFDEKTLQPTYRLLTGLAGASSGIEIARRFGIPAKVIATANKTLDVAAREAAEFLMKIKRESEIAEDLRVALDEEREVVAKKYALLDIEAGKREKQRQKEFEREFNEIIAGFERQSKALLASIEDKALKAKLEKELDRNKAELKRNIFTKETQRSVPSAVADGSTLTDAPIAVGSKVLLKNFGSVGTVEKLEGTMAEVLVGSMRMREKIDNLQAVADQPQKQGKLEKLANQSTVKLLRLDEESAKAELNIIGKKTVAVDEEVDRFLDESFMNGFSHVRIIHGMGTGALRGAVHDFLRHHPHVAKYTLAPQDQGGAGATIVELKN